MASRLRYRKARDLRTTGVAVDIGDGLFAWLTPLNQFDQQDAREAAATARAKRILALHDHDQETMDRVRAEFVTLPIQDARRQLVERDMQEARVKTLQSIHSDPEWEERLRIAAEISDRDDLESLPLDHPERAALRQINMDYMQELSDREDLERSALEAEYQAIDEQLLEERWVGAYLANEGDDAFMQRYKLEELLRAVRVCAATPVEDGEELDHESCGGHKLTVYADLEELKSENDRVFSLLVTVMRDLNVSAHEAKGSGSRVSSSGSSRLPSDPEGSLPSTPEATSTTEPGSSASPSPMD